MSDLLSPADTWAWLSSMGGPKPQSPLATLKPGPAPTGSQKVFDSIYGALGGTPDKRSTASALSTLFDAGTLGLATGAYDGAQELAKGNGPGYLAAALMPGMKPVGAAAKAAAPVAREAVQGIRAYHESNALFDKFDLSKIGTGDGNAISGKAAYLSDAPRGRYGKHTYEVALNADPVDVNTRVGDLPSHLQEALTREFGPVDPSKTVQSLIYSNRNVQDFDKRMTGAGIPAVKDSFMGPSDYAVYDPSLIEILRKYGLLPPAALGAAAAGQNDAEAAPVTDR